MPFEQGPYLTAAFLCERVLEEKDGVKSAIRIFDRTTRTIASTTASSEMEPFSFEFCLVVQFKAGSIRGPHQFRMTLIRPSGESPPPTEHQVYFEGEDDRGVDIVIRFALEVTKPGVYWFRLEFDDEFVTKVPWRVIYAPLSMLQILR